MNTKTLMAKLDLCLFAADESLRLWKKDYDRWDRKDFVDTMTNFRVVRDEIAEIKAALTESGNAD